MRTIFLSVAVSAFLLAGCGGAEKVASLEAENQQLKIKLAEFDPPAQQDLAYKVATIAAGATIPSGDRSIEQARRLLKTVSEQYHTPEEKIADMAVYVANDIKKAGIDVTVLEILDGASIYGAVDGRQWRKSTDAFAEFCASYAIQRKKMTLPHEEATRGLVALQSAAINLGAKKLFD